MSKVILIYANCHNPKAKGDFAFAGGLAKDISLELSKSGETIDIILTSTLDGMHQFESLYGVAVDGRVTIEGQDIGVCSLELFDAVENKVVAFIEANRCKHAAADLVKRVLSPDSKFLFVGNANQSAMADVFTQTLYRMQLGKDQPGVYTAFDSKDIFIGSAGPGVERLGLPALTDVKDLPALTTNQAAMVPSTQYGFMYVNAVDGAKCYKLIAQYFKLTNLDEYVLVGDFAGKSTEIEWAYNMDTTLSSPKKTLPQITYHQSLPNVVMRKMTANATGALVLSTGIMSVLEVMKDRKLPYYQDLSNNTDFVASFLIAVKSIVASDSSLFGAMPQMIIELSNLLFADKPLSRNDMERTHDLLAISSVNSRLIAINEAVIDQASGKIAPRLLSFIGSAKNTQAHVQLATVCASLRKPQENGSPVHDQALRRAAFWGRLFELKVLIASMSAKALDLADKNSGRTALHWAASEKHLDCARALVAAGASLDIQDNEGKTALHKAVINGDKPMIKMLIEAGASVDIPDKASKSPKDCADSGMLLFIKSCHSPQTVSEDLGNDSSLSQGEACTYI